MKLRAASTRVSGQSRRRCFPWTAHRGPSAIRDFAARYNAMIMIDDAHARVSGKTGEGRTNIAE